RVEERDDGVERVDAAPRPRRGVRRLAEELGLHLDDPEARPPHLGAAASVDHHGGVHALEDAGVLQLHLAGAALLGGRADDLDAAGERQRAERGQRRARADGVGAAHVAASNSRRASLTSVGLTSRSHVVMAMILADVSMPSRASGCTAACSNAREWIGVPSGAICTIGWMAGMTWLTLPTSELPMRSRLSGDSATPTVRALARTRSSRDALPRRGRGVRRRAAELEARPRDAEQVLVHDPAVEAVDHHRGVHRLEDAALDEPHLAAAALLGGRADDLDATLRQLVAQRGQ